MNMKPYLITICLICFGTLLNPLSAQEEVDYASRFYEIRYTNDTIRNCPDVDSVEVLDIYGKVYYSGDPDKVGLSSDESIVFIYQGGFCNAYDINGKILLDEETQYFLTCSGHIGVKYGSADIFTPQKKDGKLGSQDKNGDIQIPFEYEYLAKASQVHPEKNCYFAKKNNKFGLIDAKNNILLPFEYDDIIDINNEFGEEMLICYKNNDEGGFTARITDINTVKFLSQDDFSDIDIGMHLEYGGYLGKLIPVKSASSELWGCIDSKGRLAIPCKYKMYSLSFKNVNWNWLGFVMPMQKNNDLWDVMDEKGNVLVSDCQKVYCDIDTSYHLFFAMKDSVLCAYHAQTGKKRYSVGNYFMIESEGSFAVIEHGDRKGVLDLRNGKIVVPVQYGKVNLSTFECESYAVGYNDQYHLKYCNFNEYRLDFIQLKDGKIIKSIENFREDFHEYGGVSHYLSSSGDYCLCSIKGDMIIDEHYHLQNPDKDCYISYSCNCVFTPFGIFDKKGKLLYKGNYKVCCSIANSEMLNGFKVLNKQTNQLEYFAYCFGKLTKVDSYDAIYRYYYTQCQEKFRKQPSDVDKNIPETNTTNSNTYAFIIANEDYPSAPVPYGLNDGRSFKTYCEKTLGIPANHVILFENATQGKINSCVEQIKRAASANNGDIDILFYYAGHAFPDEETKSAYLLPIDGDATISATAYSLDKLYGELGQLNVNSVVCFIDACFSGVTRDDNTLLAGRAVIVQPKNSEPRGNMVVFTAAQGTETAHQYQAKKHGMFTYYLLKKLQESKGEVTLGELADYLNSNVKKMSFEVNSKLQTPKVLVSPAMELKWRTLKLND